MTSALKTREYRTWILLALALLPTAAVLIGSGYLWSARSQELTTARSSIVEVQEGFGEPPARLEFALMSESDVAQTQLVEAANAHIATLQGDRTIGAATAVLVAIFGAALFRMTVSEVSQRRRAEFAHGYAEAMLEDKAERDPATGALNRRGLERLLPTMLSDASHHGDSVVLACLDLDSFKSINDVFGHSVGDQILRSVGQRLSDFVYDGVRFEPCRFGGDDFVVFAKTTEQTPQWLADLGEAMINTVGADVQLDGRSHQVGLSLGIATSTADSSVDSLILEADSSLIIAKRERGRAVVYNRDVSRTGELVHALPHALASEVTTHIQPVIDVRSDEIVHVEALARWNRSTGEQVPPSVFVPLAESYGLAEELTTTVLRSVQNMMESAATPADVKVWINVSPHELDVVNFGQRFLALLDSIGVPPDRIGLEITETAAVSDPMRLGTELAVLRDVGIGLAIDDFGNGYTPLGYLRMLPVDTVKLDRSLISHIDTDTANQHMVTGIVGLCNELGMTITAEGVEREEEKLWLCEHGIFQMQGYLFGYPGSPEQFDWDGFTEFLEDAAVLESAAAAVAAS